MAYRKVYRVAGTYWVQRELKYKEFLQVMEILKGQFTTFAANEQALGDLVQRLADQKVLPKLGAILLRPSANPVRRLVGAFRPKITRENVVEFMTLPQLMGVLLDFFNLNVISMLKLIPSANVSSSFPMIMEKMKGVLSLGNRPSGILPVAISEPPNGSAN